MNNITNKIKQRKCPFGKVELCSEYGNCGDCTWHKVIEKYERKLKKLQAALKITECHKGNLERALEELAVDLADHKITIHLDRGVDVGELRKTAQVEILKSLEDKAYYGFNDTRCVDMSDVYELIEEIENDKKGEQ